MHKLKLLISLVLLGYGGYILYQHFSDEALPVPAVVVQSFEEYRDTSPNRPGRYYYTFEYEYSYQGQRYLSDQYTYGGRDTAEAVCNYKTGDTVTAYIDPKNPASAVIKRDISGFVYGLTLIGLLMLMHTILAYIIDKSGNPGPLLQKAHNVIGPLIGLTVLGGGLGYFVYVLILAATDPCAN